MLIKNSGGRIVAVDSARAKVLLREPGYAKATADEVAAWEARHTKEGRAAAAARPDAPTSPKPEPTELEASLSAMTKAELIILGAESYGLDLKTGENKDDLIGAILEASGR